MELNSLTTTLSREDTRSVGMQRVNSGFNRDKCQNHEWDSNPGYKIHKLSRRTFLPLDHNHITRARGSLV